jgi:hypothetical protein
LWDDTIRLEPHMTWIIGTPTMFGYSFGISDVRVTLGGNREIDCLQKVHPVGRFIAAGFAGTVRIGFEMVDGLRQLLYFQALRARFCHDPRCVFLVAVLGSLKTNCARSVLAFAIWFDTAGVGLTPNRSFTSFLCGRALGSSF